MWYTEGSKIVSKIVSKLNPEESILEYYRPLLISQQAKKPEPAIYTQIVLSRNIIKRPHAMPFHWCCLSSGTKLFTSFNSAESFLFFQQLYQVIQPFSAGIVDTVFIIIFPEGTNVLRFAPLRISGKGLEQIISPAFDFCSCVSRMVINSARCFRAR